MCNCLKEAAEKLESHLKGKIKVEDVYSFDHIGFDHEAIIFNTTPSGKSLGTAIGLPFSIRFYRKKKDGSRAKNSTTIKTNLFMSYCPLCGEKYPVQE